MISVLISDDFDSIAGFNLIGIKSFFLETKEQLLDKINILLDDKDVSLILISSSLVVKAKKEIFNLKLNTINKIILEVPSIENPSSFSGFLDSYLQNNNKPDGKNNG
ncbi:MAG: V-type ATP synthase subunit F [Acholeplasmatales bacterium]|jgi:V/A-type H+-transporting ATPase subunit F|nr:V-type ATP synthase subunit F [Acholeplasmatales bacterium]